VNFRFEGAPRGAFSSLGLDFVQNFCCGMILRQRRQLLDASFERCLELLQVCESSCTTRFTVVFLVMPGGIYGRVS
jgi:hypothetical protein